MKPKYRVYSPKHLQIRFKINGEYLTFTHGQIVEYQDFFAKFPNIFKQAEPELLEETPSTIEVQSTEAVEETEVSNQKPKTKVKKQGAKK